MDSKIRPSLNVLDDDALTVILSYLNVEELIGLTRVCKRWEKLTTYLLAEATTLRLNDTSWNCRADKLHCDSNKKIDLNQVEYFTKNWRAKIKVIPKLAIKCPNLICFHLTNQSTSGLDMDLLDPFSHNIQCLNLQ